MEPLTAIGLAASIINIVDFALQVVSKGNKIYHSCDGVHSEHGDLELVANDMLLLQNKLQLSSSPFLQRTKLNDDDRALHQLSTAANEVADQLLQKLNKAKAQGRFRRWKSLRQAVKSVWSKREVDGMATRLTRIKDQIQLRAMVSLRPVHSPIHSQGFANLNPRQDVEHTSSQNWQDQMTVRRAIMDLTKQVQRSNIYDHDDPGPADTMFISQAFPTNKFTSRGGRSALSVFKALMEAYMQHFSKPGFKAPEEHRNSEQLEQLWLRTITNTLFVNHVDSRLDAISERHAETFSWIFEERRTKTSPWSSFPAWLRSGTGIYWIHGKAASGKSTLMKYVTLDTKTAKHLRKWAGDRPLITAHFFCWNLGMELQKTQAGLVSSLVHQIFTQHPELVKVVLPELWEAVKAQPSFLLSILSLKWYSWTFQELRELLTTIMSHHQFPAKWCIFIDGLDEFDGEHQDIISIVQQLVSIDHVKVCLSSRPLVSLEDVYGSCPQLRLQDLTAGDIKLYVFENLAKSKRFQDFSGQQPVRVEDLVQRVVDMSSGVFLWVILVVRSLQQGLANRDQLSDLETRLRQLPPELEDLFQLMLSSIRPSFYINQGSRLFQIMYQAGEQISALKLSFADESDDSLCLSTSVGNLGPFCAESRFDSIEARVKTRTAGLLEVLGNGPSTMKTISGPSLFTLAAQEVRCKSETDGTANSDNISARKLESTDRRVRAPTPKLREREHQSRPPLRNNTTADKSTSRPPRLSGGVANFHRRSERLDPTLKDGYVMPMSNPEELVHSIEFDDPEAPSGTPRQRGRRRKDDQGFLTAARSHGRRRDSSDGSPRPAPVPEPSSRLGLNAYPVQYLHLTVRDFLEKPDVWAFLLARTNDSDFDSSVSLARGSLLSLKYHATLNPGRWDSNVTSHVKSTVRFAGQAEMSTGVAQIQLLEELDTVCTALHGPQMGTVHWCSGMQHGLPPCSRCPTTFLTYSIARGMTLFVRAKIGPCLEEANRSSRTPLLIHATIQCPGNDMVHQSMIAFLLRSGLDPNERRHPALLTPWEEVLAKVDERVTNPTTRWSTDVSWLEVCNLYLMYGADRTACAPSGTPATELLLTAFYHLPQRHVDQLRPLLGITPYDSDERGLKRKAAYPDEYFPSKRLRNGQDIMQP
ncbi:hypothetical protein LTR67_000077 [Exophiala xenobiotica]